MARDPEEVLTERLLLRRVRPEDTASVLTIQCDPVANQHESTGTPSKGQVTARLAEWIQHWECHGFGYWLVSARRGGEALGLGGLEHRLLDGEPTLNLFYRFRPRAWGKGYAREMALAALEWATASHPELPPVVITNPTNRPAIRLAERMGFVRSGMTWLGVSRFEVYRRPVARS